MARLKVGIIAKMAYPRIKTLPASQCQTIRCSFSVVENELPVTRGHSRHPRHGCYLIQRRRDKFIR
ncbi:hypothetical protein F443_12208 [Phytophthora nicotianae P1569]|uniref:Uncharacterized protein n=2 Tax=Phytophthora nicotianae TaxID=4792 RepID=V9ETW3_PHYNI|nr:hypothetical protein F443_12208 [Phytophthora nicotianae P1569]ETO71377.1 hypothetical protein F444_12305 [Phytophthora nicotianae P1976]